MRIGRHFYCDGGMRLNTPLSPALRLGADRLLLIALRYPPDARVEEAASEREVAYNNPAYLLGKVLNALLLDHIDYDLQRMRLMNAVLAGGEAAFGPEFLPRINEIIRANRGANYRVVRECVVRPSEDLGRLAGRAYNRRARSFRPARMVADLVMQLGGARRSGIGSRPALVRPVRRRVHPRAHRARSRRRRAPGGRDRGPLRVSPLAAALVVRNAVASAIVAALDDEHDRALVEAMKAVLAAGGASLPRTLARRLAATGAFTVGDAPTTADVTVRPADALLRHRDAALERLARGAAARGRVPPR